MEVANDHTHPGAFQTTLWTVVRDAGEQASVALEQLCENYWAPLYGYALKSGYDQHQAKDLTQGFFSYLLGSQMFSKADPSKGRFRTYLLTAFKRYMVSEWRRHQAQKRGGHLGSLPWEEAIMEPFDDGNEHAIEKDYDRQWAIQILDHALTTLRLEYETSQRIHIFNALQWTLSSSSDSGRPYAAIAQELQLTESAIKMNVKRMRARYGDLLRHQVAQTVFDPRDVDDEIRYLISILQDHVT